MCFLFYTKFYEKNCAVGNYNVDKAVFPSYMNNLTVENLLLGTPKKEWIIKCLSKKEELEKVFKYDLVDYFKIYEPNIRHSFWHFIHMFKYDSINIFIYYFDDFKKYLRESTNHIFKSPKISSYLQKEKYMDIDLELFHVLVFRWGSYAILLHILKDEQIYNDSLKLHYICVRIIQNKYYDLIPYVNKCNNHKIVSINEVYSYKNLFYVHGNSKYVYLNMMHSDSEILYRHLISLGIKPTSKCRNIKTLRAAISSNDIDIVMGTYNEDMYITKKEHMRLLRIANKKCNIPISHFIQSIKIDEKREQCIIS